MSRTSENSWTPDTADYVGDPPADRNKDFGSRKLGKPIKTMIGVGLLVVVALVLSRMNPVPHDIPEVPSWTTGQTSGTDAR